MAKIISLREFETTQSILGSPRATYQAFITEFYKKTASKKILKNLLQLYNIFEN